MSLRFICLVLFYLLWGLTIRIKKKIIILNFWQFNITIVNDFRNTKNYFLQNIFLFLKNKTVFAKK